MTFITQLNFTKEKKQFVQYEANPVTGKDYKACIEAAKYGQQLADDLAKQPGINKITFKTIELGSRTQI